MKLWIWLMICFHVCQGYNWMTKTLYQIPKYKDWKLVESTMKEMEKKAPLVFAGEVRELRKNIIQVSQRQGFLLMGGDCAETFDEFSPTKVKEDLQLLMQMSLVLSYGLQVPVFQIARTAGQFAKPRSDFVECRENMTLPSYFGDIVNDFEFNPKKRNPDPRRMVRAYDQSVQTLNLIRAFIAGGYTEIDQILDWKTDLFKESAQYRMKWAEIEKAIGFLRNFHNKKLRFDRYFTGHECLLLPYEQSLTRMDSITNKQYDCSGHFLWLGERTRYLDSAQVEFMRGIDNPLGIKISTRWTEEELYELVETLNPKHEGGKIVFIIRMGHAEIKRSFPSLVQFVQKKLRHHHIVWVCDPMHGNTETTANRVKTRRFDRIQKELELFFEILQFYEEYPGGVHLELTSQSVTECMGGNLQNITELKDGYLTKCDPRLNAIQALEIAFQTCRHSKS